MPEQLNMQAALQQAANQMGLSHGADMSLDRECQQMASVEKCTEAVSSDLSTRCDNMLDALEDAGIGDAVTKDVENWEQTAADTINCTIDRINEFLASFSDVTADASRTFDQARAAFVEQAATLAQELAMAVDECNRSLGADIDRIVDEGPDDDAVSAVLDEAQQQLAQLKDDFVADLQRTAEKLDLLIADQKDEATTNAMSAANNPADLQMQEQRRQQQENNQ